TRHPPAVLGPAWLARPGGSPHGNIWDVPDAGNGAGSEQAAGSVPRPPWRASLWLWPAATIGLAGIAGALFGVNGALFVGGEALAARVVAAGILTVSRDRWLTIVMAAALAASVVVFVGLIQLGETHQRSSRAAGTVAAGAPKPADWQWRRVTQAMAQ